MSRAYVSQYYDSEKWDCPAPFGNPESDFDRQKAADKVSSAMRNFMGIK